MLEDFGYIEKAIANISRQSKGYFSSLNFIIRFLYHFPDTDIRKVFTSIAAFAPEAAAVMA